MPRTLHPNFVAELNGLDLSQPLENGTIDQVVASLDDHAVVVLHGPALSEEQQAEFASHLGPLESSNGVLTMGITRRITPRLVDISNLDENDSLLGQEDRRRMFSLANQLWHTDSSFKQVPATYSMLHAHTVVPEGGETQFVDMRAAYDALAPAMKAKVDDLLVEHSIFTSRAKLGFADFSEEEQRALPPVRWPLVRTHPGSGRKALYLASHASHIVGWPVPEGRMLIRELMEHATQPHFIYSHQWDVGDVVIWDNRTTMHRARPFDDARYRRDMRRATIADIEMAQECLRAV